MGEATTTATLWDLLVVASDLARVWDQEHTEAARLAIRDAWGINIACPGAQYGRDPTQPGTWERCTPTVVSRDGETDTDRIHYQGACLGCGWVSEHSYPMMERGENGAAEDAQDHAWPGWRDLPVVDRPPSNDSGSPYNRAVTAWRARWAPILPAGWIANGGPIRTQRKPQGTRHVPGGSPGGGYDMSAGSEIPETPGGQLGLFA